MLVFSALKNHDKALRTSDSPTSRATFIFQTCHDFGQITGDINIPGIFLALGLTYDIEQVLLIDKANAQLAWDSSPPLARVCRSDDRFVSENAFQIENESI
jgi:hypothetical protein